jgi:hypothetical protein
MSQIISAYTSLAKSNFTIVNQGTEVISDYYGGIVIAAPAKASSFCTLLVKTAPTPPYSITMNIERLTYNFGWGGCGVCWYNSTSGKIIVVRYETSSGSAVGITKMQLVYSQWADVNLSSTADLLQSGINIGKISWYRLVDDNTTRYVYISRDGYNWKLFYSEARTTYITPNSIGFQITPINAEVDCVLNSYKIDYSG